MLTLLSHYLFQQRLLFKAQQEYPGCKVVLVEENHTSKKNMWSIMWNHESEVGWEQKSLVFKCAQHCDDVNIDRDLNASRNILLPFLSLFRSPSPFSDENNNKQQE